jgi:hypothetical protein
VPDEKIGDVESVETHDHPPRTDSPEYGRTRKALMKTPGGCYVCDGPVDLSHPGEPETKDQQDHHGGGIFLYPEGGSEPILVGFNLFGMEWSLGWGALPARVAAFVTQLNVVVEKLGGQAYTAEIATVDDVMAYVDSFFNASVKLCAPHHIGHESSHSPDHNGNEAVGIHNGPVPIWLGQATCDWANFDMWGGSTGTVAVAKPKDGSKGVEVVHVSPLHPDQALYSAHQAAKHAGTSLMLPAHHGVARLAHAGSHTG